METEAVGWMRRRSGRRCATFLVMSALVALPKSAGAAGETPEMVLGISDPAAGSLRVAEAVQVALRDNPQLRATRRAALAAERRIRPAGALADPQIGVSVSEFGVDGGAEEALTRKTAGGAMAQSTMSEVAKRRQRCEVHAATSRVPAESQASNPTGVEP